MIRVINIFAGPGTGKSITAAGLFNIMKLNGERVELVTEFAKDLTYEGRLAELGNQFYVTATQDQRLRRHVGHCEWVITDSPLPIAMAYMPEEYAEWLPEAIWDAFDRYENFNVLLHRRDDRPFEEYGRTQNEAQARILDNVVDSIFAEATSSGGLVQDNQWGEALELDMDIDAPHKIYHWLKENA